MNKKGEIFETGEDGEMQKIEFDDLGRKFKVGKDGKKVLVEDHSPNFSIQTDEFGN